MRILVFSDTHNDSSHMAQALALYAPHYVIHLGDGVRSIETLKNEHTDITFIGVRGNNDFSGSYPEEEEVVIEGFRFYLTHGHKQGVKYTTEEIVEAAKNKKANVALYGHTHIADYQVASGIHIINPGSANPRITGGRPTAALIAVSDNALRVKIIGI